MNRSRNTIVILVTIMLVLIIGLVGAMVYIYMSPNNEVDNDTVVGSNIDNTPEDNNQGNVIDESDTLAVETFNANFESFEGIDIVSAQIKSLISKVEINNTSSEHIITLNEEGITTIDQVKDDKKYDVEFSYDDEGYINEIKITATDSTTVEQNNNASTGDIEKLIFNTKFTPYLGDITGSRLIELLKETASISAQYPEHQVTLTSNNLENLNGIVETEIYTITLSYDVNGYVSNINIDKKIQ